MRLLYSEEKVRAFQRLRDAINKSFKGPKKDLLSLLPVATNALFKSRTDFIPAEFEQSFQQESKTQSILQFADHQREAYALAQVTVKPATFKSDAKYTTCVKISFENTSRLKEHISRTHKAQYSGCKIFVKTQPNFEKHINTAILNNPLTECTAYKGLFEDQIEDLKNLKIKRLGPKKSWEEFYKFLFPNSALIPSPWFVPSYDSYENPNEEELRRRLVAYVEAHFECTYSNIIANKDKILQILTGIIPDKRNSSPLTSKLELIPVVGNGEGPSSSRREGSLFAFDMGIHNSSEGQSYLFPNLANIE
ncbi:hypothetical protein IFR05_015764 [Cadophora sp. M221]|nr:hypothetical protein IFR05_015764 [Cadophora sp. M221]